MIRRALCLLFLLLLIGCYRLPATDRPELQVAHIGFGSCLRQDRPAPILDIVSVRGPELFLFLGDNIYADTRDMAVMAQKYRVLADQPAFKRLRNQCPFLATWDDHDYGENDAGKEYPLKAEAAVQFFDFFDVPEESPRRSRAGIYGAERVQLAGLDVQVLMLDTRTFRSALLKKIPPPAAGGHYVGSVRTNKTLLGEAQWAWLEDQLRQPADLRLLLSSIQVIPEEHYWEKWMNFPREQARLFTLLRETGANGVILLSGDRHHAEISQRDDAIGYPLVEVTASSFNNPVDRVREQAEPNRYRRGDWFTGPNVGWITLRNFSATPQIQLQILDETGRVALSQLVELNQLQP